jgi:hypothetical protein
MTLSIMTLSIMTRRIITISRKTGYIKLSVIYSGRPVSDIGVQCHYAEWHYAEWHYAECRYAECCDALK